MSVVRTVCRYAVWVDEGNDPYGELRWCGGLRWKIVGAVCDRPWANAVRPYAVTLYDYLVARGILDAHNEAADGVHKTTPYQSDSACVARLGSRALRVAGERSSPLRWGSKVFANRKCHGRQVAAPTANCDGAADYDGKS